MDASSEALSKSQAILVMRGLVQKISVQIVLKLASILTFVRSYNATIHPDTPCFHVMF